MVRVSLGMNVDHDAHYRRPPPPGVEVPQLILGGKFLPLDLVLTRNVNVDVLEIDPSSPPVGKVGGGEGRDGGVDVGVRGGVRVVDEAELVREDLGDDRVALEAGPSRARSNLVMLVADPLLVLLRIPVHIQILPALGKMYVPVVLDSVSAYDIHPHVDGTLRIAGAAHVDGQIPFDLVLISTPVDVFGGGQKTRRWSEEGSAPRRRTVPCVGDVVVEVSRGRGRWDGFGGEIKGGVGGRARGRG
mmetsp:Transcript_20794/g.60510  ORF Transcript_20794/g.60510 Transcript_20794/m.60510 type:complete len:245 (-) Transcript_20794:729-1463(-)